MAAEDTRIIEFTESMQISDGDYVMIDSESNGVHKYKLKRIVDFIGALGSLDTQDKSSLVAAINEVAQYSMEYIDANNDGNITITAVTGGS